MSDAILSDLLQDIKAKLVEAFDRGVRVGDQQGAQRERQRIIRAATEDPDGTETKIQALPPSTMGRVAHGTIRPFVRQVLQGQPNGLTKFEVADRVQRLDARIARISIWNELHRNEGRKGQRIYRKKGYQWSLAEEAQSLRETAAVATNDQPPLRNGAGH